jgi:hypothetical protein
MFLARSEVNSILFRQFGEILPLMNALAIANAQLLDKIDVFKPTRVFKTMPNFLSDVCKTRSVSQTG